jgi:hypothetical protein
LFSSHCLLLVSESLAWPATSPEQRQGCIIPPRSRTNEVMRAPFIGLYVRRPVLEGLQQAEPAGRVLAEAASEAEWPRARHRSARLIWVTVSTGLQSEDELPFPQ